jgi:radical SAM-linked protein
VQRLRIRYAKRGRARFTSHRDFGRAFERALRRAGVPMAYSSGFSPHPRISYANAAPTGAASEAEYLEIGLARQCDPDALRQALDAALPEGLDIVEVVPAGGGALADRLTGSRWQVSVVGVDVEVLRSAAAAFLAASSVEVKRLTKNGVRSFDARQAVLMLAVSDGRLELVIRHTEPLVRPDDVLAGLALVEPRFLPSEMPVVLRLEHGTLDVATNVIRDPLAR